MWNIWRSLAFQGRKKKSYICVFSVDNISHFRNLGYFPSPSVMRFHRIGSLIICPTAKTLVFLTKCMYLWLWHCGVQWYLPLSAVLGGFCVVLRIGVVSPRRYTLPSTTDSQAACLLISLCEIPEKSDSIKNNQQGGANISIFLVWF